MTIWMELTKPLDYGWTSMKGSLFYGHQSLYKLKPGFHMLGKIPDNRGFYFLPTIPDFADISDIREEVWQRFSRLFVIGGLEFRNLGDW